MEHKIIETDVLVLGAGVAGLRAAVAASESGLKVCNVSKGSCASPEILGFNAPVKDEDSEEAYFEDLERSGYGINDSRLAHTLTDNVMKEVEWLEKIGVHFQKDENGKYVPIHTLGTKYPRLIKAGKSTGSIEMKAFLTHCEKLGIPHYMPVDILGLIVDNGEVHGAYGIDKDGVLLIFFAKAVVLALGGCGALQSFTTYPKALIGDGYIMAYEAGATLVDMEFQQFEPCCFVYPEEIKGKVIATTLLRHGAELLNGEKHEFMEDYGLTRDNAQKGSLSRAMLSEVKAGRGTPHNGIYYNMTMMTPKMLYDDHAIFTNAAVSVGMDLTKEMPEMMPAAHTNLGGVTINTKCETEIPGLFACGEVTGGLHGGNRLGGCAGAETVVFGHIAGDSAADYAGKTQDLTNDKKEAVVESVIKSLEAIEKRHGDVEPEEIRNTLGECMRENMGILRDKESIGRAAETVACLKDKLRKTNCGSIKKAAELIHCKNMLLLAEMQIKATEMRKESRGVFYRTDYPETDSSWNKNILIRNCNGEMKFSCRDAIKDA